MSTHDGQEENTQETTHTTKSSAMTHLTKMIRRQRPGGTLMRKERTVWIAVPRPTPTPHIRRPGGTAPAPVPEHWAGRSDTGYVTGYRSGRRVISPHYPPEWPERRRAVRRRARGQCELCGLREGDVYLSRPDGNGVQRRMVQGRLQIMHPTHDPRDIAPDRLVAGCNRCHGVHDRRHHDGHGGVTGAMWGTLTRARLDTLIERAREGAAETGRLEPGEVELLLLVQLAQMGRLRVGAAAILISRAVDGAVAPEALEPQVRVMGRRLALRWLARVEEGGTLVYALNRPICAEEGNDDAA